MRFLLGSFRAEFLPIESVRGKFSLLARAKDRFSTIRKRLGQVHTISALVVGIHQHRFSSQSFLNNAKWLKGVGEGQMRD